MIWENRQLVTDEPVEFEKEPVEVQERGKLPIILEEIIEYTTVTKYEVQKYNTYLKYVHVQRSCTMLSTMKQKQCYA